MTKLKIFSSVFFVFLLTSAFARADLISAVDASAASGGYYPAAYVAAGSSLYVSYNGNALHLLGSVPDNSAITGIRAIPANGNYYPAVYVTAGSSLYVSYNGNALRVIGQ